MYATGTVECICPAFDSRVFDARLFRSNLCTYDYTLPDMYTTVPVQPHRRQPVAVVPRPVGRRSRWRRRPAPAAIPTTCFCRGMAAEPTDLLVLPYFTPSGTPYFDATTPAPFVGLRWRTTRGQVLRALLEGVAMEMRLNVEILERPD